MERLEAGELPLEESLALFEKGVGSLKRCHAILDQAEKRVQVLIQNVNSAPFLSDSPAPPQTPARAAAPISRPTKSDRQSIDAATPARQNTAPRADKEELSGPTECDPGGSLFGGSQ